MSTRMGKCLDAYTDCVDCDRAMLRFFVDGEGFFEFDTPATLQLEDGAQIDVFKPICGD